MDCSYGKTYNILNTINDDTYAGSTTQSLSERFSWHRCGINSNKKNCTLYKKDERIWT